MLSTQALLKQIFGKNSSISPEMSTYISKKSDIASLATKDTDALTSDRRNTPHSSPQKGVKIAPESPSVPKKAIAFLIQEIQPINPEELDNIQQRFKTTASLNMLELIQEAFLFLDKIPSLSPQEEKNYLAQKTFIQSLLQAPLEKKQDDLLITSLTKIKINGPKTFLFAQLYDYYLKIFMNCNTFDLLDPAQKNNVIKAKKTLEKTLQQSSFAQEKKPSNLAIIQMIHYHDRREKEAAPQKFDKQLQKLLQLLTSGNENAIKQAAEKALNQFIIHSITLLINIIERPENYFYTTSNADKNEVLKDLLFMYDSSSWILLERQGYLDQLFNGFAFTAPEISTYFDCTKQKNNETKETLIALLEEKESEFNCAEIERIFVKPQSSPIHASYFYSKASKEDDYENDYDDISALTATL